MVRIAINGFGRIGRCAFKIAFERRDAEIVAVNNRSGDPETFAHLLKHDSVYGLYDQEISADEKNIIVDSYNPSKLKDVLCVGDYGFILRKKDIINEVAFPNKYLEYLSSRLRIITTRFVNEVAFQVKTYNLGIVLDDVTDYQAVLDTIQEKRLSRVSFETLGSVLYYNSFERTLSSFMKYLNKSNVK